MVATGEEDERIKEIRITKDKYEKIDQILRPKWVKILEKERKDKEAKNLSELL